MRRKLARLESCSSDVLGDQLGLNFGACYFFDLDVDPPAHQLLQLSLQSLDLLPLTTDDDARPGGEPHHFDFIAGAAISILGSPA